MRKRNKFYLYVFIIAGLYFLFNNILFNYYDSIISEFIN
jgi:hypothetical protein